MLEPRAADTDRVIHRMLVLAACACSLLVVASFAMFASDQLAGASAHQVAELNAPQFAGAAARPVHHAQPRRFIDGAASTLTSPFSSIVQSDNPWIKHALPSVFALLIYGVGIGYAARFTRGMAS